MTQPERQLRALLESAAAAHLAKAGPDVSGIVAQILAVVRTNPELLATLLKLVAQNPTILSLLLDGLGVGPVAPAPTEPPPVPPGTPPKPVLAWPDRIVLLANPYAWHPRHPDMTTSVRRTEDGSYFLSPDQTSQFDSGGHDTGALVVTLEPGLERHGSGLTVAEADDDDGPNAHLRWRTIVCAQNGDGPIMEDGGTGAPDDKQEPAGGAFARLKEYNSSRGMVCRVRVLGGDRWRLWIEMETPGGRVFGPNVYLAPVQQKKAPADEPEAVVL